MKKGSTLLADKEVVTLSNNRHARMLDYLERTRPAFVEALAKSQELGAAANGVLAGPTEKNTIATANTAGLQQ